MLKKTCLIFVFLTLQTTFYGFNADFSTSSEAGITLEEKMEARYVISPYDHVIRNISEREGNDWRLMSAIAYHESRFKADIVSRGAHRIQLSRRRAFLRGRAGADADHACSGPAVRRSLGRSLARSGNQCIAGQ